MTTKAHFHTTNNLVKHFDIILDLITDDLKTENLLRNLSVAGFDRSKYQLSITKSVFSLMGLDEHQEKKDLEKWYKELLTDVQELDLSNDDEVKIMASSILIKLTKFNPQK
jgi:hypothetical protein